MKDVLQNLILSGAMEFVNVTMVMLILMVFVLSRLSQVFNAMLLHSLILNFKNVFLALMVV